MRFSSRTITKVRPQILLNSSRLTRQRQIATELLCRSPYAPAELRETPYALARLEIELGGLPPEAREGVGWRALGESNPSCKIENLES
jgi:hypothetical protein